MSLRERLARLRQALSGAEPVPVEDERLVQLFWNRANLKKELSALLDEREALREKLRSQEGAVRRARELTEELERYLGQPAIGLDALVYFQLRGLWRACADRLGRSAAELRRQQEERERRRRLIEFDQQRRRKLAAIDRQLLEAQSQADTLEAKLKLLESRLAGMQGVWHYFGRRQLVEQIASQRQRLEEAMTKVTDLSDERYQLESSSAPEFESLSVDGRRVVNIATIAMAQHLVARLSGDGLVMLVKEATVKRIYDVRYGSPEDCTRLMRQISSVLPTIQDEKTDLDGLRERIEALRAGIAYRSDEDAIPLPDSTGTVMVAGGPVSEMDTIRMGGVNVLLDDYWDVYSHLIR